MSLGISGRATRPRSADLRLHPADASRTPELRGTQGIAAYLRNRRGSEQVALFDRATGRTYLLAYGPRLPQYTASIVKVDIMAMW